MIRRTVVDGAPGHAGIQSGIQTLDQREAATLSDGKQSCSAVIQVARENDSNHAGAEVMGGALKERVDGRAVAVLFRPPGKADVSVVQMKMPIRRGNVDPAGLDRLAIGMLLTGRPSENA